jgi:hypothetical protein
VQLEGLGKLKTFNDLIGTRNSYLPACSIAPQSTTLLRVLNRIHKLHRTQKGKINLEEYNIVTCMSDYRRGLVWRLDLLTIYTLTTREYTSQITDTD